MIESITRQPEEGVIGGLRDLSAQIAAVADNFTRSYQTNIENGITSVEQGRNHDPMLVSLSETLTPDRPGNASVKAIPWVAIGALAILGYLIVRKF